MSIVTGNPANNPTSITVADDGEKPKAADVSGPVAALLDKCSHILEGNPTLSGNVTITGDAKFDHMIETGIEGNPPEWTLNDNPGFTRAIPGVPVDDDGVSIQYGPTITLAAVTMTLTWPLNLPDGALVDNFYLRIDPVTSTAPTTRTTLSVQRLKRDGSGSTTGVADTTTGASYVAEHDAVFPFSLAIDNESYAYWIILTGESGVTADAVTIKSPPFVHYTLGAVDFGR